MYMVILKGTMETKVISRRETIALNKEGKLFLFKKIS